MATKKKKKKPTKLIIAGVAYVLMFASAATGLIDRDSDGICGGKERWEVKVMADVLADDVKTKAKAKVKTIEELNAINTETYHIKHDTKRQDLEKQLYTIKNCFITHAVLENDNDIHLVIEDGNKHTMVAELPDPKCKTAKKSEYIDDFIKVRKAFMEHKKDYDQYLFDITGVMFIDKEHGINPTGNADNNIELHPVIKLKAVKKIK